MEVTKQMWDVTSDLNGFWFSGGIAFVLALAFISSIFFIVTYYNKEERKTKILKMVASGVVSLISFLIIVISIQQGISLKQEQKKLEAEFSSYFEESASAVTISRIEEFKSVKKVYCIHTTSFKTKGTCGFVQVETNNGPMNVLIPMRPQKGELDPAIEIRYTELSENERESLHNYLNYRNTSKSYLELDNVDWVLGFPNEE